MQLKQSCLELLIKVLGWCGMQMIPYVIHAIHLVVSVGTTRQLKHSLAIVPIDLEILIAYHRHLVSQQVHPLSSLFP
jgi:hypothetical protein